MSNSFWSRVQKVKRRMARVGAEGKLFCVVCKVQRPVDPPVNGEDNYVVERLHDSIRRRGYACILLRDFYKLKKMYGVDWDETHRVIFPHKKKNAYALLYADELPYAAKNAMKNHFETKICEIVDINYQSFYGNTTMGVLTIRGTKTNGRHLSCDFVDAHHAETFLSIYKTSHGAGGNSARVEPRAD